MIDCLIDMYGYGLKLDELVAGKHLTVLSYFRLLRDGLDEV
jgi:hypothetical protein